MQHVDEALLVAYADDALSAAERGAIESHLATCAACRARVDEERALSAQSAAILAHTAPGALVAPPFEDVLRRAGTGSSGGAVGATPRRRHGWVPLAWAASLIVAIGAGWIARMMLLSPELDAGVERVESAERDVADEDRALGDFTEPRAEAMQRPQSAPGETQSAAASPIPSVAERGQTATGAGRAEGAPQQKTAADVAAAQAPVEPRAAEPTAAEQTRAEASVEQARAEAPPAEAALAHPSPAARALAQMAVGDTAGSAGAGSIAGRLVDAATGAPLRGALVMVAGTEQGTVTNADGRFLLDDVPAGQQNVRMALIGYGDTTHAVDVRPDSASAMQVALEPASVALDALVVTAEAPELERRRVEAAVSTMAAAPVDRAIDAADAEWRGTPGSSSSMPRAMTPHALAGVPVDSIWIGKGDAWWRARVVQRADGTVVEVIEWRGAGQGDAPADGELTDGRSFVTASVAGATIELRGRLPRARLQELAVRLQPIDRDGR